MSLLTIQLPVEVTATGAKQPVNISAVNRVVDFILSAKSNSGSSPTLDAKLQSSSSPAVGASYTTAGTEETPLNYNTADNVKLAAKWTQSGNRTLANALLRLKRNGALAAGTLTLELYADSSGPTGSALASATFDVASVPTDDYADCLFTFASTYELANSTVYWLVLTADFATSATDNITWHRKTSVAGAAGNSSVYDSGWTAATDKSFLFQVFQYTFTDVTGGAFTQVDTTGSWQVISLWADDLPAFVRVYNTIGGTATPKFHMGVVARY